MIRAFLRLFCLWCLLASGPLFGLTDTYAAPVDTPTQNNDAFPITGKDNGITAPLGNGSTMTDIHDIKSLSPVVLPMSLLEIVLIALIGALVFALIIAGWLFWRRRKQTVEVEVKRLPPDVAAKQRLALLDKHKDINDKEYYVSLSSIFREYIEGRYGIDGLEMTTEELLPQLDRIDIDKALRRDTKAFVAVCDPVKFADAGVTGAKREIDFALIKTFVEKTTIVEEEINGDGIR